MWYANQCVVDILFDEISQIYRVGNNICLHIGSDCGIESGTHTIKKEKARLIIPIESIGSIISDFSQSKLLVKEDCSQAITEEKENEDSLLGEPFHVDD